MVISLMVTAFLLVILAVNIHRLIIELEMSSDKIKSLESTLESYEKEFKERFYER